MEKNLFEAALIAPCGLNCGVCYAYVREKNRCPGCRSEKLSSKYCKECVIKNCSKLSADGLCGSCDTDPCKRLKGLHARYKLKYNTDLFDNIKIIQERGMEEFLRIESEKRKCPTCGGVICVHKKQCITCGK